MNILQLPNEIIYEVLKYIDPLILETYINVPKFNKYVINYLYPVCEITTEQTHFKSFKSTHKLREYIQLLNHDYDPQVIASELGQSNRSINVKCMKLRKREEGKLHANIKELHISCENFHLINPNVEILIIEGCHLNLLRLLPDTIHKLKVVNSHGHVLYIPKCVKDLEYNEFQDPIRTVEPNSIEYFSYKGNLSISNLQFHQFNLSNKIKSISLSNLNLKSIDEINEYTELERLEILQCPNLNIFNVKLPFNLKTLIYRLQNPIPSINFNLKHQEYLVINNWDLPSGLKTLVFQNHPLIKFNTMMTYPDLRTLDISNTAGFFGNMNNLKLPQTIYKLIVKNTGLEQLKNLPKNLVYLDASKNRIKSINLNQLKHLKHLCLQRNYISAIDSLPEADFVNLQNNPITHFQSSANYSLKVSMNDNFHIPKLRHLELSYNSSTFKTSLPSNLESLYIHHQYFKRIDFYPQFFNFPEILTCLTILNGKIPPNAKFCWPNTIEEINISANWTDEDISLLLRSISTCPRLNKLSLSDGKVSEIILDILPSSIVSLTFKKMSLTSLKGTFPKSLKCLNLEQNRIQNLVIPNVEILNLSKNNIADFQHFDFNHCSYLEELYLQLNPLPVDIDQFIHYLKMQNPYLDSIHL